MKRILALVLALMLALGMVAMAETEAADMSQSALISNLTGVTATVTRDGQTQNMDLGDLGVSLVVDTEDALRFVLTADKGEEILTFAVAEIVDGKIRASFKGIDRTFEQEIPETPGVDISNLAEIIRPMLPALMGTHMPELKVAALPKLDLAAFAGMMGSNSTEADGVTTTTVDIPATMVSMALSMVVQVAQSSAESIPQGKQVVDMLDQLVQSGFSFAIKGTITDNGAEQDSNIGIYMANEGETAADPTLFVNTTSAENNFVLAIDLPSEDSSYTIGQLSVVTDPAAETIDAGLDFAGMSSVALKIHKHDELQCADLTYQVLGEGGSMTLEYGRKDDQDYYGVRSEMGEGKSYTFDITGAPYENGYAGTIAFDSPEATFNSSYFELLGDFDMAATLDGYTLPADIAAFSEMTSEEINAVLAPIQEALTAALGTAAPAEEAPAEEAPAEKAPAEEAPAA